MQLRMCCESQLVMQQLTAMCLAPPPPPHPSGVDLVTGVATSAAC